MCESCHYKVLTYLDFKKIKGIKMILCMDIFGNRMNKIYDM